MSDATEGVRLLYFSWVRERIGRQSEEMVLPAPMTLSALADLLAARSAGHASAFADHGRLRAAINQQFSGWNAIARNGDEVAFFPPVTGGN